MNVVHGLGNRVAEQSQVKEQQTTHRRIPGNLTIKSDAFMIKLQKETHHSAQLTLVHHWKRLES